MKLVRASALPKEDECLAPLLDDLSSVELREVYADWLEERGDKRRAKTLRATAEFLSTGQTKSLERMPAPKGPWSNLVAASALRSLVEQGLNADECREWLALARPGLAIDWVRATGKPKVGSTRMWGNPDLPRTAAWPTLNECKLWASKKRAKSRQSCKFVAQFNFAELSTSVAARALPREGLLSLFSYVDPDLGRQAFTLRFTRDLKALAAVPHPPADDEECNGPTAEHEMVLREALAFPEARGAWSSQLSERAREADLRDEGDFFEGLLGHFRSTTGGVNSRRARLLYLSSELEGSGRAHIALNEKALRRGDFSAWHLEWMDWD